MVVGKVADNLCLTPIIKELKFSFEQSRVVTTLNLIKHKISYFVQLVADEPVEFENNRLKFKPTEKLPIIFLPQFNKGKPEDVNV